MRDYTFLRLSVEFVAICGYNLDASGEIIHNETYAKRIYRQAGLDLYQGFKGVEFAG
jgi:hypothetical protein